MVSNVGVYRRTSSRAYRRIVHGSRGWSPPPPPPATGVGDQHIVWTTETLITAGFASETLIAGGFATETIITASFSSETLTH